MSDRPIDPGNIAQARSVIDTQFTGTPQFVTPVTGAASELLLKVETVNPLRSFKGRGTDYLLAAMQGREPLACASAGNFGQALALAAARRNRPVHVFTARNVDPFKAARMRRLGAEVHITDEDFDGAKEQARQRAKAKGWFFVEDGGDPRIAEGAGTIAAEMEAAARWPDAIVAPVGNGSLINGLGAWSKHRHPGTMIVAAAAAGAPAMEHAWRTGDMAASGPADTIADGIAARVPVPAAIHEMRRLVDDFELIDDAAIVAAMRYLYFEHALVSEPAGAAGVAVALALARRLDGALIAAPVCGSNIAPHLFAKYICAADHASQLPPARQEHGQT